MLVGGAALLSACGGSDSEPAGQQQAAPLASGATILQVGAGAVPPDIAQQALQPAFHVAPVLLAPPEQAGAGDALRLAARTQVTVDLQNLSPRRLTVQTLQARHAEVMRSLAPGAAVTPQAAAGVVTTYTPAQIRAAYGLPALPATTDLSGAQAVAQGAGQTIYIIDAQHDPNLIAELAAFNQKFALPTCSTKAIASNAGLPLGAASGTSCELSVVYSTAGGAMTSQPPSYDSGWATEITLDVQWAHATAPLARIVLIEAPDASINSLLAAVRLANAMGPGVVSMSFGGSEGNWTAAADSAFTAANMSYLAATGDAGAGVSWPAVSSHVLAVGGTTLSYGGAGARSEQVWSGTGGGVSHYTPAPSYQGSAVPGMGSISGRTVADVAFNADPYTGQYVAVIPVGGATVNWISAGGTSLSTPQWAGLVAIANATRSLAGKAALGAPHAVLYDQIATAPDSYASAFADIVSGSDGLCAACSAKVGYDQPSGLGTPNAANLLGALSGVTPVSAPVVTSATISGQVGTALSFNVSVSSVNPVSFALSGAPAGMNISGAGAVSWPAPLAGSYIINVIATDSKNGLSGQGAYTVVIAAPTAPVLTAATINGKAGVPLSFTVPVTSVNPVSFTLSGAPSGMTIGGGSGVINWSKPALGNYAVTVVARDTKTGLSGQAKYMFSIAAGQAGPVITAPFLTGVAGRPLIGAIGFTDPNGGAISVSISGVPMGMMFWVNGMNIMASWSTPLPGNYQLKITATDSTGATAQATMPITVFAR
ncbi:S53 family peptidase [Rugamonas sp.]|uniref:S53 family peptidase n=1 Tax=Rugamonas sp. TaxID=1926287 RepID=UPI0025EC41B1|nr:S53 family peptidase [Rugamonas sp.]